MTSESSSELIARLRRAFDVIVRPMCADLAGYALLDFPDHSNVGDSAIWLGETQYLRQTTGRGPSYVSAQHVDWARLERLPLDHVIFLHGGGNFGDLWPMHQHFREEVIARCPDHRIVQLPQTVHFDTVVARERASGIVGAHRDFTLLVRDASSLEQARSHFDCRTELCPDSAVWLSPGRGPCDPSRDLLYMLRSDVEAGRAHATSGALQVPPEDWLDEPRDTHRTAKLRAIVAALFACEMSKAAAKPHYFDALAGLRVKRGLAQLCTARRIVSDRLHVHILSTLLGIEHVMLDNSYGKISGFMTTWNTAWRGVAVAKTISEANAKVAML